tara:strand:+ start:718 stop:939 length:222 start_codon:yes stop_codon:yes gene_type:complete
MDVFNLIVYVLIIYLFYLLINTISSLRDEVKEMKEKCINGDESISLEKDETRDLKKELKNNYNYISNLFKNML